MRGLAGDPGRVGVADELERVGAPGVLGEPLRVEVELAGQRVEVDVLEDRRRSGGSSAKMSGSYIGERRIVLA